MTPSARLESESVRPRRRLVRLTAAGVVIGVAAAAVVGSTGANAAAKPVSQSEGRFLTGTAAGQSFDTVAALEGEKAEYPANPGPNANDLKGSVLGQALNSPAKNISVPIPGGVTFGAVGQYASASSDGSAKASSGLIGSNGDINVAGSGNDATATVDVAKLPGASSLTDILGDLQLTIGALSSQARQAAFGKKLADPSAECTGGNYSRVSNSDQAGSYQFANLTLGATSPLLATLGSTLTTTLSTLISQFDSAAKALPGGLITVTGLPTAAQVKDDFSVSLAGGGITASLADGSLKIDLAKILKAAGLDLNNLCPNTSLVPYLAKALADLPSAINTLVNGLVTKLSDALGGVKITVAGTPLDATTLTNLVNTVTGALTTNLTPVTMALDSGLQPAIDAITDDLLGLKANAQDESDGVFTEAALVLALVPNGGSLPTLPAAPTIPGLPANPVQNALAKVVANAKAPAAKPSSKSSGSASPHSFAEVRLASARQVAPAAARPVQAAPAASSAVLQLNLALSAVTNNAPATVAPTTTTPATGTAIPTGVPAGAAGHHGGGSPALPIVLVLLGLVLAGGGVTAYRVRGRFSH